MQLISFLKQLLNRQPACSSHMWMLIILLTNTAFHSGLLGMNCSQHILCHLISCVYCEHLQNLSGVHERNLKKEQRTLIKLLYQMLLHVFKLELVCTDFYSFLFVTSEDTKTTYQVNSSFLLPLWIAEGNADCERERAKGLRSWGKEGPGSTTAALALHPPSCSLPTGALGSCSPRGWMCEH